jgi:hypothetical protein
MPTRKSFRKWFQTVYKEGDRSWFPKRNGETTFLFPWLQAYIAERDIRLWQRKQDIMKWAIKNGDNF